MKVFSLMQAGHLIHQTLFQHPVKPVGDPRMQLRPVSGLDCEEMQSERRCWPCLFQSLLLLLVVFGHGSP